jgi:hypothetical protein
MNRSWFVPAGLSAFVFAVHVASPNATPFDSRWTVHTALSLIGEGDADLDEYLPALERDRFYAIECVLPGGRRVYPVTEAGQCSGGRLYHFYPVAVPVLAAPLVAALSGTLPVFAPLAARLQPGPPRSLLEGDLAAGSMAVELILASFVVALAAAAVFLLVRRHASPAVAAFAALVFAFATPAWSTGSRALWMHGFSMLLLPVGLLLVARQRWLPAGAAFALAFFVRPTNAVAFAFTAAWALWTGRRPALGFLLGALPVAAVFTAFSLSMYGDWLAPYSLPRRSATASLGFHARYFEALLGNLASPARGLLVYSPVLLFSFHGLRLWLREREMRRPAAWITAVTAAHYLLICSYEDWFGGHSYGPRYFSDLASVLVLPLGSAWLGLRRTGRLAFCAALAAAVFMHAQGAWCWPCVEWNTTPEIIERSSHRLWDWRDPPFLR